jgi:hypothetical protein
VQTVQSGLITTVAYVDLLIVIDRCAQSRGQENLSLF